MAHLALGPARLNMPPALLWALGWLLAGLGAGAMAWHRRLQAARRARLVRMRPQTPAPPAALHPVRWDDGFAWLGHRLSSPKTRERWRARLEAAQLPWSPEAAIGMWVVAIVAATLGLEALAVFARLPAVDRLLFPAVGGGVAYLFGPAHLRTLADRRRQEFAEAFPDVLDLLAVSLAAGLTWEAALGYLIPELEGTVRHVLDLLWQDLKLGLSRREALERLARRTGLEAVERVATLVIQAEQLGSSLYEALTREAEGLRAARLSQARERATRLPVQMTIPIVFFLLPALYVVLLGPAALNVLKTLAGGG
ncbi:MAG: type II secretion system F family protein [Firmicutes bacterium]|nr:type II secretion system F family protein [Alicyclobacillaceae bacterium]MCL6497842.1 type II secretion system F family protein [Bacillota bacterium]